ncbi:MAG: amino acid ABC transporter substrate-binding protein [Desulfobulbaceae bacterium]|nr:amino acid ABC transporter substrate-binding protein [Desulfobulbaceae bacterium]
MRKLFVFTLCTLFLLTGQALAAGKIVNGIDANFPPFAFIDKTGKPSGFDVDAMDWIAKDLGLAITHVPVEWDGIVTSLVTKKIDIIASGMSISPERAERVNFTIPYWIIKKVFVVKNDSPLTAEEIYTQKKTLGVQQGTTEAKWLREHIASQGYNVTLKYYSSAPLAVEDLLNGRIDAAAMDSAPAHDAEAKKEVKILGTFGMPEEDFGYAVRKDDAELLDKVNTSLKKLMASPYWDELIEKYELNQ